ncbi:MAG: flagellar basal-body rod protein FlgG [Magnetococcales bacterium]|nr:flagellar basal-body rod protein FlgG [Magnetococcales bacterium]MBF0157087.1 flagellar basal-body rod protein FlgG [Magnetococcales bacterium]
MIRGLWTAATGMQAQQTHIDVIANNLANVNTTGFKTSRTDFQDLLYANIRAAGSETSQAGTQVPTGIQLGHGVKVVSVAKDFTQGSGIPSSQDPMNVDMMIQGQGFFQIELPSGDIAYTRDGSFKVQDGNIVTSDGYPLVGGQIGFDPTTTTGITVEASGSIGLMDSGTPGFTPNVGQLQIARFVNPSGLTAIGNNLFKESQASGTPQLANPNTDGFGAVNQHYLEQSNVSMVTEMVDMITTQRAYEIGSKAIQTADSMLGLVANLKR